MNVRKYKMIQILLITAKQVMKELKLNIVYQERISPEPNLLYIKFIPDRQTEYYQYNYCTDNLSNY